tara:strand:- start:5964 stop:6797 length:834 start_codon:yes stop_codon:yes gene_type:complete
MTEKIGWINNRWGSLNELNLPINDRGLNYSDGIFETILILGGVPQLLTSHIKRWQHSAQELEMDVPPNEEIIRELINEGINRCSLHQKTGSVRLNWSRGYNVSRGIDLPVKRMNASTHRFWLEINSITTNFNPISTIISRQEKRNANSKLSSHKTFAYIQSIQARQEALQCGCDEALMESTNGEICCGTTANIIIKRKNKYLTPRIQSGCLPGIMRQQGLNAGLIKESQINIQPESDDEWLLINSLSCRPIYKVNDMDLPIYSNPKAFWLSLLKHKF